MRKKIAIVVQRYGAEVNGGSEVYTRMLSEHLAKHFDVDVITTCALDYISWENHYPEGTIGINGVKVHRFIVDKTRKIEQFTKLDGQLLIGSSTGSEIEQEWIDAQGPYCPKLIDYIRDNKDEYDVFVFVTYLYYLTIRGIEHVSEKSILIPTAHDEPYIYLDLYKKVFSYPKAILFLTDEERLLVNRVFDRQYTNDDIIGTGIEVPKNVSIDHVKEKYGLSEYFVYVGRIDIGKNCPELFDYFIEYKRLNPSKVKLVLIGREVIPVPDHPDIISLGFINETEKFNCIAGAKIMLLPSLYESLSLVVLESMALGTPVIVNGKCEVSKGHCIKSNAGLYYSNFHEFKGCIDYMLTNKTMYDIMSKNARDYVENNCSWDIVTDKFIDTVNKVLENEAE